jgi:hypothetical protein
VTNATRHSGDDRKDSGLNATLELSSALSGMLIGDPVNPIMDAANNEVPENLCNYAGLNFDPSAWAAMGQGTKNNPYTTAYDFARGFSMGGYLDAQPMATGSTNERPPTETMFSEPTFSCRVSAFRDVSWRQRNCVLPQLVESLTI